MRDATDYYNLLSDSLKNGVNQIKYIYDKIENAKYEGKYINIRTGYLIQEKDSRDNNYYFNYNQDFPLCYSFSCCGLARKRVIKRILDFYLSCLKEYDSYQDEDSMREKIKNEIESAKTNYLHLNKKNKGINDLKLFKNYESDCESKNNKNNHEIKNSKSEDDSEIQSNYWNTSEFINDESESENESDNKSESENDNEDDEDSFIDNKSIEEKKEKKKRFKLVKKGKKVINKYKEELNNLKDDLYDGEDELNNEDNEEEDEEKEDEEEKEINDY